MYRLSSGGEINQKGDIKLGESFTFEEYTYTLGQADQNRLQMVIRNILKPSFLRRHQFPETVDIPSWEVALQEVPMDYITE